MTESELVATRYTYKGYTIELKSFRTRDSTDVDFWVVNDEEGDNLTFHFENSPDEITKFKSHESAVEFLELYFKALELV